MSNIIIELADFERDFSVISGIRSKVFHQEQQVDPKLDIDGQDKTCQQLIAYLDGEAVGTTRIKYLNQNTAKIERLAVLSNARRQGIARKLMLKALEVISPLDAAKLNTAGAVQGMYYANTQKNITDQQNITEIIIHAQEYIKGLYEQLGFEQYGEAFVEAGINHIKMKKILITP
ncbi:GNAT family N-acetyltransferase [Mastigocoleus sp. MO_188.B34]|uniref:GNAT family N-acetyltransferase n=1 Tax=Mastigocoleus sp. MO_188.B34 TaxID=3036635 RepID=UPI00260FE924|nr:GNAT family N-acetyltransferase [Mastigocoleus sp. MO_188.B34]MDJ0696000.1 GNAT family N-acetyltransferase [Mastigocoleus sp. MO_188.B34]